MGAINVAYVLTPIFFGGAEKVSLNFLRSVDRDRFRIRLLTIVRPWEEPPLFIRELEALGYGDSITAIPVTAGVGPLSAVRVAWHLHLALRKVKYDLVHTHGYYADTCALPSARLLGMKCMTTCHGYIANKSRMRRNNTIGQYAIRLCDSVVAVSEEIKEELVASGLRSGLVKVLPNAVETEHDFGELEGSRVRLRREMGLDDGAYVIGFLGRLSQEKGLSHLLGAFSELHKEHPHTRLAIVGDGPERAPLEQMVDTQGLADVVYFAGFQSEPLNWLASFDCFVLPSLTEGTPLALLEAMSLAVPVVATNVGGVGKILRDGVNGFIVSAGNSALIKSKLEVLTARTDVAKTLGDSGRRTVLDEYSLVKWCRAMEETYLEVVGPRQ